MENLRIDRETLDGLSFHINQNLFENTDDVRSINGFMELIEFIKHCSTDDELILAGGALRSYFDATDINDLDIFVADKDTVDRLNEKKNEQYWYDIKWVCEHSDMITLIPNFNPSIKIQVIVVPTDCSIDLDYQSFVRERCNELIDTFDIRAGCIAAGIYTQKSYLELTNGVVNPLAIRDAVNRNINFNSVPFPVATLKRVMKYKEKGYSVTNRAMYELMRSVREGESFPESFEEFMTLESSNVFARYAID